MSESQANVESVESVVVPPPPKEVKSMFEPSPEANVALSDETKAKYAVAESKFWSEVVNSGFTWVRSEGVAMLKANKSVVLLSVVLFYFTGWPMVKGLFTSASPAAPAVQMVQSGFPLAGYAAPQSNRQVTTVEFKVVSISKTPKNTYLNSTDGYKNPMNVAIGIPNEKVLFSSQEMVGKVVSATGVKDPKYAQVYADSVTVK